MFPLGNAARATRWVSLGIGAISCGWRDIAILLRSKDGDQTPSLQTLLASGLCEITLRCLMMPHEIGIGPRLMSCKSEFASSIFPFHPEMPPAAIRSGADMALGSIHKTIAGLQQASIMLLRSDIIPADRFGLCFDLFESTS